MTYITQNNMVDPCVIIQTGTYRHVTVGGPVHVQWAAPSQPGTCMHVRACMRTCVCGAVFVLGGEDGGTLPPAPT